MDKVNLKKQKNDNKWYYSSNRGIDIVPKQGFSCFYIFGQHVFNTLFKLAFSEFRACAISISTMAHCYKMMQATKS